MMICEGGNCKSNDLEQGRGDRLKHSNEGEIDPLLQGERRIQI